MTPRRRHAPITAIAGVSILSILTLTLAACGGTSNESGTTGGHAGVRRHPQAAGQQRRRPPRHGVRVLHGDATPSCAPSPGSWSPTASTDLTDGHQGRCRRRDRGADHGQRRHQRRTARPTRSTCGPACSGTPTPPRAVTAQDVVRGFKRLCNPVSPSGAPGYYTNTIAGHEAPTATASRRSKTGPRRASPAYIEQPRHLRRHDAGRHAPWSFDLLQPASDFLNILAMPFASAAPVEYLKLPAGQRARSGSTRISDGPYQITKLRAGKEIDLTGTRRGSSPPTRSVTRTSDRITITDGLRTTGPIQQQICRPAPRTWRGTRRSRRRTSRQLRRRQGPRASASTRQPTPTRTWSSTCRARTTRAR